MYAFGGRVCGGCRQRNGTDQLVVDFNGPHLFGFTLADGVDEVIGRFFGVGMGQPGQLLRQHDIVAEVDESGSIVGIERSEDHVAVRRMTT